MDILLNAIPLLGKQTGIGHYTRKIAEALVENNNNFNTTYFYGYCYSKKYITECENNKIYNGIGSLKKYISKYPFIYSSCKKISSMAFTVWHSLNKQLYDKQLYDCYFEPNFVLLPQIHAKYSILTVHDFSCFLYPQWHPYERVHFMEKYLPTSLDRADIIITVSETIRKEAIKLFNLDPNKVIAIPNGVDLMRFHPQSLNFCQELRKRLKLPEHFILSVGTIEPRKNLLGLLKAYSNLPIELQKRFPLLLVGAQGWNNTSIFQEIKRQSQYVHFLGYVNDRDLPGLYCTADVFVYPSYYEGFGLPALEALACGCPVLISKDPALCEVCGDAALQISADDVDSMTNYLKILLNNKELKNDLKQRGIKRAALYSWDKSIYKHLELFQACSPKIHIR